MNKLIFYVIVCFMIISSCEEKEQGPSIKYSNQPSPVANIEINNVPGGAEITYTLPEEEDVAYVRAEYTLISGQKRRVVSSKYKNHIEISGFSRSEEKVIRLYTVDNSENSSNPVEVVIKPKDALIHSIIDSIRFYGTFGGIVFEVSNEKENELVLHTEYIDSLGMWSEIGKFYITQKFVRETVRGFEAEPVEVRVFLTDVWKNASDTIVKTITPLFEEELDKSLWTNAKLPGDFYTPHYASRPFKNIYDGSIDSRAFLSDLKTGTIPAYFTLDLGGLYKLGRMKMWPYQADGWFYERFDPRYFEIYASETPSEDWSDWTLLGSFESLKPSGAPTGTVTDEDINAARNGYNFVFEPTEKTFRYFRFRTLETWSMRGGYMISELSLWGQIP